MTPHSNTTPRAWSCLEELRNVVELEQYQGVAARVYWPLCASALEPNLERDLGLFEDEVRQSIEDEVVLRFHYAAGMVERSLTKDPATVGRALMVFGDEMSDCLRDRCPGAEAAPTRE